ncbi:MAG: ornithine cyclodeaminase family protein [Bacteroidales bacterium]|nr:ornithine cyclodeaminase family protein [Bacteroidales bacterium]
MSEIKLRIISQEDVSEIFKGKTDVLLEVIEESFLKYIHGDVLFPDKISQIFDMETQNRINCMPATLLGEDMVCGMKWVSVFPTNAPKGIQNVTGVMLLSEINTGFPVAVIDGTLTTKMRTSGVGCVAAKYLAPSNVKTIGIIGSGEEARMHFALLKHLFPTINECRVSSRTSSSEESFIRTFNKITSDVTFIACNNDSYKCASNADIIITAISGQSPVLKAKDVTKGGLYIHVGGWEDEYEVALKAQKIVCDDWEASKHRTQTICRMYKEGILKDHDIYANLSDLISGRKKGRDNDDEFIYFNSVGLSYIDLNLANYIYRRAKEMNLGHDVTIAESSIVNYKDLI